MHDLAAAGLSEPEAKVYTALLSKPDWLPSQLAAFVQESRTNIYKILDRLVELGLAERYEKPKKLHYRASNPSRLIELAQELKNQRTQAEQELELKVQNLAEQYIKTNEQPGVRFFQGQEKITNIFEQLASSTEEVRFVHTSAGVDFYGFNAMHDLRMKAVKAGVARRALTPDTEKSTKDYKEADPLVLLSRTWLKRDDYTAPVEWGVFDNTLYIISYGQEALGLTIESQNIADAFKQLFALIERGQKLLPNYHQLPKNAKTKAKTR